MTFSAQHQKRSSDRVSNFNSSVQSKGSKSRHTNSTVYNQAAHLNLNRIVLYKRGHFIETANSFFIVEISSSAEGSLYIAAYDIQSNTSLLM